MAKTKVDWETAKWLRSGAKGEYRNEQKLNIAMLMLN